MLCPQGVGTPHGEETPVHLCPVCAGNLLRGARTPPRLSLANNVIDARSPQLDGAPCRPSLQLRAHSHPSHHVVCPAALTDAEKRAVAPVNVRGGVTCVTSERAGGPVRQNAQLRGHTLVYVAAVWHRTSHGALCLPRTAVAKAFHVWDTTTRGARAGDPRATSPCDMCHDASVPCGRHAARR